MTASQFMDPIPESLLTLVKIICDRINISLEIMPCSRSDFVSQLIIFCLKSCGKHFFQLSIA